MNGEREGIARCIEQVNSCSDELARLRSSTDECMAGLNRQWNDESAARFYAMYDEIIGGHYFSSNLSLRNPSWAYAICFYLDSDIPHISDDSYRVMGHSIRPVSE